MQVHVYNATAGTATGLTLEALAPIPHVDILKRKCAKGNYVSRLHCKPNFYLYLLHLKQNCEMCVSPHATLGCSRFGSNLSSSRKPAGPNKPCESFGPELGLACIS